MTPPFVNLGRFLNCLGKLRCWLFGHDWTDIREICHRRSMVHLHVLAGCRATCARCEEKWRDSCDNCHEVAR